jgi:hypothetical protein
LALQQSLFCSAGDGSYVLLGWVGEDEATIGADDLTGLSVAH